MGVVEGRQRRSLIDNDNCEQTTRRSTSRIKSVSTMLYLRCDYSEVSFDNMMAGEYDFPARESLARRQRLRGTLAA